MRPMRPEERQRILDGFPEDRHDEISADIEEYQALNAMRFRRDPDRVIVMPLNAVPPKTTDSQMEVGIPDPRVSNDRLRELRRKLFEG